MALLYRVDTVTSGLGGTPYFSSHYFDSVAGTAAQAHAAVVAFWLNCQTSISSAYTMVIQGQVTILDSTTGAVTTVAIVPQQSVPGSAAAGTPLPASNQALMQLRTGVYAGGRELRGRLFIMGGIVAGSTAGRPSTATITSLTNAGTTLAATVNADWVVYGKVRRDFSRVTGVTIWSEYAILRSRRD